MTFISSFRQEGENCNLRWMGICQTKSREWTLSTVGERVLFSAIQMPFNFMKISFRPRFWLGLLIKKLKTQITGQWIRIILFAAGASLSLHKRLPSHGLQCNLYKKVILTFRIYNKLSILISSEYQYEELTQENRSLVEDFHFILNFKYINFVYKKLSSIENSIETSIAFYNRQIF